MAFIRASQGGGGELTPTTLWTNKNPYSNFGEGPLDLNDSIGNYKYIKFSFKCGPNMQVLSSVIYETEALEDSADTNNNPFCCFGNTSPSGYAYIRIVYYINQTRLWISKATRFSDSYEDEVIPLEVIGLN